MPYVLECFAPDLIQDPLDTVELQCLKQALQVYMKYTRIIFEERNSDQKMHGVSVCDTIDMR